MIYLTNAQLRLGTADMVMDAVQRLLRTELKFPWKPCWHFGKRAAVEQQCRLRHLVKGMCSP